MDPHFKIKQGNAAKNKNRSIIAVHFRAKRLWQEFSFSQLLQFCLICLTPVYCNWFIMRAMAFAFGFHLVVIHLL